MLQLLKQLTHLLIQPLSEIVKVFEDSDQSVCVGFVIIKRLEGFAKKMGVLKPVNSSVFLAYSYSLLIESNFICKVSLDNMCDI